jgi:SAM-dependent methyltransferase
VRANSFNFVPVRDVARPSGARCPLRARPERIAELLAGTALARSLFVRLPDRMRLCSTSTSDFDDHELARIKLRSGQLYADVSSKLAPDDFARDLVKLGLRSECTGCDELARCAGCYSPEQGNAFAREDRRVREILRSLTGSVLDIGCGEGPYVSELDSSRVDYLGLDPDAQRIELLRARHPWARFVVGSSSQLRADPDQFSHVLLLRSYNHLPDPDSELARAAALLAPGGTLLIVDNVAFGLVRSRDHARRAESSSAGFEHFRNHGAEQAHARVMGLELIERRDVGPATSNQWLLHYRKPRA